MNFVLVLPVITPLVGLTLLLLDNFVANEMVLAEVVRTFLDYDCPWGPFEYTNLMYIQYMRNH